jgi:hypothetical protein
VIAWAVAAAHNPEPVERRKVVLHTVSECTVVARKVAAVEAAGPIVVAHKVTEAVRVDSIAVVVAHMVVVVAHRAAIADPVPVAAADLDRKT